MRSRRCTSTHWPARSLYPSPIENTWEMMGRHLVRSAMPATNLNQLKQQVELKWNTISQDDTRRHYDRLCARLQNCIVAQGAPISVLASETPSQLNLMVDCATLELCVAILVRSLYLPMIVKLLIYLIGMIQEGSSIFGKRQPWAGVPRPRAGRKASAPTGVCGDAGTLYQCPPSPPSRPAPRPADEAACRQPAQQPSRLLTFPAYAAKSSRPLRSKIKSLANKMLDAHAFGATVAERLARSPPTKANRVQSPAGSPDFCERKSCRTMPLVGGFFSGISRFPASSLRRCFILTSITLIGSQDLAVKSRPNLFTHSSTHLTKAATSERSLPTKTYWVLSPDFRTNGNLQDDDRRLDRFARGSSVPPPLSSNAAPYPPRFTLLGTQDPSRTSSGLAIRERRPCALGLKQYTSTRVDVVAVNRVRQTSWERKGKGMRTSLLLPPGRRYRIPYAANIREPSSKQGSTEAVLKSDWLKLGVTTYCWRAVLRFEGRQLLSLGSEGGQQESTTVIAFGRPARTMRANRVSIEQRRNERVGGIGDHLENRPASGIVRHDSHMKVPLCAVRQRIVVSPTHETSFLQL
ncbi:hypothetical protein PR048_017713 [Dryococelus australis]|uniref:Uncharacterized protein n=1 Tax=Dryococelus australis TaxID=614101 RepID=A0ABQ9HAE0_9NEOP|nr:hypothetical protein PR048_017713 [Dryococelus australis]